ncbi:Hypothetical protein R9X50_00743700 [Acrodontium crateriforme]|uniref:non-specific serine/threonine protein kinase n=1 Tax=Acrodontium crateriforme TaxID=150365 RepID=A0AAQ3RCR7_9PEZI|nr:Hypothetical protein R9X50_00743700 [Acrodontium crateriforme]
MGQGYSQTLPPGPGAIEATELSDLTFERGLGGTRFLRTIRARHRNGIVVAKLCVKANSSVSFKQYAIQLLKERQKLRHVSNVLPYQRIRESSTHGLLVRQYIQNSLYDRISIRPFLEIIEKKWIAFQLLCALRDCHAQQVFHGDIKSENVLVTSWNWVYLTDFSSSFKPVYLPEDNPADFSFYFDISSRRTCYIAPERFLAAGQPLPEDSTMQWNMDVFSLGCVLAELFTESPIFTLSQLFRYRKGEYDPTGLLLTKIDDEHVRALISSMIRLNPEERLHISDYLHEYKNKAFPLYFYQHLHVLMQDIADPTSGRKPITLGEVNNGDCDDRIDRIYNDFEMLAVSLDYEQSKPPSKRAKPGGSVSLFPMQIDLPNGRHTANSSLSANSDNGTFILLTVVTSSMRSAGRSASKIRACELLLAFGERLPDEAKLDRILPYVMPLLEDSYDMVLVAALRTMTQLLALVTVASPVNSFLFTQYIFPRLQVFVNSKGFKANAIVRETYASCLASLADTATRFLDMIQVLRAEGSLPSTDKGAENENDEDSQDAYDTTRLEVLEQFEGQTKVFMTDSEPAVRRAFLTSVPSLCVFFGEVRAADVLLSHLNTYMNDSDWILKCAFLKTIVGIAVYIGGANLEDFILPLLIQALADPEEFVVEQALRSLASMAEIGLLQKPKTWELIDIVARFQVHPNMWIKEAATHFVSAATAYLSVTDIRLLVTPLVQPYLKIPIGSLSESEVLDALKKPLPRAVIDMAIAWAQRADRGLFWKPGKESTQLSYRLIHNMPPVSSVANFGPRSLDKIPKTAEDDQWLGRLRNAGLRGEDEMKLLAFREYLWRIGRRTSKDQSSGSMYDQLVSLTKLKITPQTVIFDSDLDTFERRMQIQADRSIAEALEEATTPAVTPGTEVPFRPLHLNGISDHQSSSDTPDHSLPKPITGQSRRLSGLKKRESGSLSSSPSSGIHLLGKESERGSRQRSTAAGILAGAGFKNKSHAEVSTDDATASGRLNTPANGTPDTSPGPRGGRKRPENERTHRTAHNYSGNDPTVLKLLDAVYVDNYPVDAAEFGPLASPIKRGPIPTSSTIASTTNWRPQGQLVAILAEHTDRINRIAISPDHVFFLTGSDDGSVKVWDSARIERNVTHRSRQTYRLGTGIKVTSLCFVESTHTFVCTGSNGTVHVVKIDVTDIGDSTRYGKPRVLREWQIPSTAPGVEYAVWTEHYRSDSASVLVLATSLGRIIGVDLRNMSVMFDFQNPVQHGTPTCFCIGRRRDWILVGTSQGVIDLWDLRFCLKLRSWAFPNAAPVARLQLHPSRKTARRNRVCISGGTAMGEVTVWDIEKNICHEIYRPAHVHSKDRLHLRDYELRNLDEEQSHSLLSRVTGAIAADPKTTDAAVASAVVFTSLHFGLHQTSDDSDALHAFALTGGPDWKVRFWDCDRLDGCRVVSGITPEEKPTYSFSQLGLDTRVLTENIPDEAERAAEASKGANNTTSKRGNTPSTVKTSRYDTIRTSAQRLLNGHLNTITDVALLERPFGMVLSADRSGQLYIHQ